MYLIDISRGVSVELLFTALLKTAGPEVLNHWQKKIGENKDNKKSDFVDFIKKMEKKPPHISDYSSLIGEKDKILIKTISQKYPLEPFKLFVYLSILIILGGSKARNILLTDPGIGLSTPAGILKILEGIRVTLSRGLKILEEDTALFVRHKFAVWEGEFQGSIQSVEEIEDPLEPSLKATIIQINENSREDEIGVLEANIDDITPEVLSAAMRKILAEGALDWILLGGSMKKNRQGVLVQVLCQKEDISRMSKLLLTWTTSFGVRYWTARRYILDRKREDFSSSLGPVRVKLGYWKNKMIRVTPEFDDLIKISDNTGISIQMIYNKICGELEEYYNIIP